MATGISRRQFLQGGVATVTLVLMIGLSGCDPAVYTAWNITLSASDSKSTERALGSLEKVFLTLGYVKFDRIADLLDSYWLPPSGRMMVRIKMASDRQTLQVIFSEGGERTFSMGGQSQITRISEELSVAFGVDKVVKVEL